MDEDESALSEITILPDGRVYAFGITASVADLLKSLASREGSRLHAGGEAEADVGSAARIHLNEESR